MMTDLISFGLLRFAAAFLLIAAVNVWAVSPHTPPGGGSSCGMPDWEKEKEIADLLTGLSVTVADSSNCGGPGADGFFADRAEMPEFCGDGG